MKEVNTKELKEYTVPSIKNMSNCNILCTGISGEGIHHAMEGGKMAAQFLEEVITHGNYDAEVMALWHERWMNHFGNDFTW